MPHDCDKYVIQRSSQNGLERTSGLIRLATAICLFLSASASSLAQSSLDNLLSEERVQNIITLGLQNIHRGKCGPATFCKPATPEELKSPPISIDEARIAIKAGINSAILQWCGLDWGKRSFASFMSYNRHVAKLEERRLALLALLHGIQQGMLFDALSKDQGVCPAKMKERFTERLPYSMRSQ